MTFAAVAVGVAGAAVAAGTSLANSSAQEGAANKARKAQQNAFNQVSDAANEGADEAHRYLRPYSKGGDAAYWTALADSGLSPDLPDVPQRKPGESARAYQRRLDEYTSNLGKSGIDAQSLALDVKPDRKTALQQFRRDLKAWRRGGKQGDRPVKADYLNQYRLQVDNYRQSLEDAAQNYANANAERRREIDLSNPETRNALYQRDAGYYAPVNDMESFRRDPGYTPMVYDDATWKASGDPTYMAPVNTLEDLANTPGYAFGLEQGNKGIEGSAAARGSVLSGATLKALQRYGSDYASGKWMDYKNMQSNLFNQAWNRGQDAYQNAVGRSQNALSNWAARQNAFTGQQRQNQQFYASLGQSAANTQANISQHRADTLAAAASGAGAAQSNIAMAQGANQANMYQGLNNAVQGGLQNIAFEYYRRNPPQTTTVGGSNGIGGG